MLVHPVVSADAVANSKTPHNDRVKSHMMDTTIQAESSTAALDTTWRPTETHPDASESSCETRPHRRGPQDVCLYHVVDSLNGENVPQAMRGRQARHPNGLRGFTSVSGENNSLAGFVRLTARCGES